MAQLSNFLEAALINHVLRNVAYVPPATVYIALYSSNPTDADGGTEVVGGAYARQSAAFGAPVDGVAVNTADVTFPVATAPYPAPVTHFGIRDAASAGNLLFYGQLGGAAVTVGTNGQIKFPAGALSGTLA